MFLKYPDVAPTNNSAERNLRHGVIWRKLSVGTQSERGDRSVYQRSRRRIAPLKDDRVISQSLENRDHLNHRDIHLTIEYSGLFARLEQRRCLRNAGSTDK